MKNKFNIFLLLLGIFFFPKQTYSQDSTAVIQDNLGNAKSQFQEYFFEALKQQAIEKHEKAIDALEKAIELKPGEAILYVEMGKNHQALGNYAQAEENFRSALEKKPDDNRYILKQLFEVLYKAHQYGEAIPVVKKLIKHDSRYYEDLANLYMMEKQPDLALKALDEADKLMGPSVYRDNMRKEIFNVTGDDEGQIAYLKNKISGNPKNQENYLELIEVYRNSGKIQEAFAWAKTFQGEFPDSKKVHLALYKLYFDTKSYEKAIFSVQKILSARDLDEKDKVVALNTFIAFAKENPEYEDELADVVDMAIETEKSTKSNKELGDFYVAREPEKALGFYTKALEEDFDDAQLIENTLNLQLDLKKYEEAIALGKKALTVFPSRPGFYLVLGRAYNATGKPSQALENLEMGLVYLVDNPGMEANFYHQMAVAYEKSGKPEKAVSYKKKSSNLKNKNE